MERKIGKIFEYNGEWYQCVESQDGSCKHCDMNFEGKCPIPIKECTESGRSDKSYIIFKKLEKWGGPYLNADKLYQLYRLPMNIEKLPPHTEGINLVRFDIVEIEIKQNKEDMEEKELKTKKIIDKLVDDYTACRITYDEFIKVMKSFYADGDESKPTLKEFDLEAAKAGKPVCTRDGRKARIICFDAKGDKPIIALVEMGTAETPNNYPIDGKAVSAKEASCDLMMLPEKKEGWVNIYNADTTFYYVDGRVFETKDEAVKEAKKEVEKEQREKNEYIDTIRVEWKE